MKLHLLAAAAAFSLFAALAPTPSVAQAPAAADHPLVGKWQWTRRRNQCTETYDFRRDGTVPIVSGSERTDNVYSVSSSTNEAGLYRLTLKTTQHHGGKDCSDASPGEPNFNELTLYVFFETADKIAICYEPSTKRCYGPLQRAAAQ
jgi:hypothetical protein